MPKRKKQLKPLSQLDLLMEFFKKNPNKDIPHPEVVDWATREWKKRTSKVFRDPDRGIRSLFQKGLLLKVKKGVYRYTPSVVRRNVQKDFTPAQKEKIFERDGYRCVICGCDSKGTEELHADHIVPQALGGKATIKNGQTLCSNHNMMKKTLRQTEAGKKMFIRLYEIAKNKNNEEVKAFCLDILRIYEKHGINGHIEWEK
ncbi:MAG: HNH endonuclease [Chromatiales bacterium]|nr:HNH endonuclease [Chromatiales bacterium]